MILYFLALWGSVTVVFAFLAWVDGKEAAWREKLQRSLSTRRRM